MPTTSNFGWNTPADTDLVKDGAAAIRTLGNNIDASLVDLKGGTTGQVLAKATNADLDFTWTNGGDITEVAAGVGISGGGTSGAVTITNSMATAIDAKGDLIVGTGADTFARLAVGGTNGHTLQVDSSTATGVKWAANPSPTTSWTLVNSGGTNLTGAATITVSGITNADKMMIFIEDASSANASSELTMRFNSDSGNNYSQFGGILIWASSYAANNYGAQTLVNTDDITLGLLSTNANSIMSGWVDVLGGNTTGTKIFTAQGFPSASTGNSQRMWMTGGYYTGTSTISSVSIISSSGNFDGGKIYVYTAA